jgi:hypothetical protein
LYVLHRRSCQGKPRKFTCLYRKVSVLRLIL